MSNKSDEIKALSNETRLEILRVLEDASVHFAHQESADPVRTGVCMNLIAEHFELSQPTISRHLELLIRAGFIKTQRITKWTYCKRNEQALADHLDWLQASLFIKPDSGS